MLKKRESQVDQMNVSSARRQFIEEYFPDLLKDNGRRKYFVEYEFPKKQESLVKFWQTGISRSLRYFFLSSAVSFSDLNDLFSIEGSKPSWNHLLTELATQKEIYITSRSDDVLPLIKILRKRQSQRGVFEILKSYIAGSKKKQIDLSSNAFVVSIELFQAAINRTIESFSSVFEKDPILPENDFLRRIERFAGVKDFEAKLIISVLLYKNELFTFRNKTTIFYHHQFINEDDRQAFISEWDIEKKVLVLRSQINQLEEDAFEKFKQAKALKDTGSKVLAMNALSQRRIIMKSVENLTSRMLMLEEMKVKIQHARDYRELNGLLKQTNQLLKSTTDPSELINQVDMIREHDANQEQLNNELRMANNLSDIEEAFQDLRSSITMNDKRDFEISKVSAKKSEPMENEDRPIVRETDFDEKIRELLE